MINNMNFNLGHMQENVEDSIKMMRRVGRKSVLAYVGLMGMAYDFTVKDSGGWFAKAEARGERMEKEMLDNVSTWQEQLQKQMPKQVNEVTDEITDVVEKLQAGLQKFLRTNPATEAVQQIEVKATQAVEELRAEAKKSSEKAATTAKKAIKQGAKQVEATAQDVVDAIDKLDLPFEDYDKMVWNQIVAKVDTLNREELQKVHDFEFATRKRPSILKAVEERMKPEAEPEMEPVMA
ncbi:MAG: hypothetical protein U0175_25325 [Caldilineaceae bacterium]